MKKYAYWLLAVLAMLYMGASMKLLSIAGSPGDVLGYTMQTEKAVDAYAEKNISSDVVHHYDKGDYLFVMGKQGDWIEVFYQGAILYVPGGGATTGTEANNFSGDSTESASNIATDDIENTTIYGGNFPDKIESDFLTKTEDETLEEELAKQGEAAKAQAELMESQIQKEKKEKQWRIGLVVIILLILSIGAINSVFRKKKKKNKK